FRDLVLECCANEVSLRARLAPWTIVPARRDGALRRPVPAGPRDRGLRAGREVRAQAVSVEGGADPQSVQRLARARTERPEAAPGRLPDARRAPPARPP